MSDYPTLNDFLDGHRDITEDGWRNPYMTGHPACECGWEQGDNSGVGPFWRDHIDVEWRKSRTIETVEQLDALPEFVVIRDRVGEVWEKENHLGDEVRCWWRNGSDGQHDRTAVRLPAILLWHPEVDRG